MNSNSSPSPEDREQARIRRNRLLGRLLLVALGLLLLAQMIPFLMRS